MKKIILLSIISLFFCQLNIKAEGSQQFFASYSTGVNRLFISNCLQTFYATGTASSSTTQSIHFIVASDFDISNLSSITLSAYTGFTISTDLPGDRSAALTSGLSFQTTKTANASTYNFKLYIHKINKANIPFSLTFGSSYPYNTATPDFNGWGYRVLNNVTAPQLGSTTSTNTFYLAFNPCLATDSLVCNFYASNDNAQTGLSASINTSTDGVTWTTIRTISNNLPLNSATTTDKRYAVLLPVGTQYVQYLLTAKGSSDPNININAISIKNKAVSTGLNTSGSNQYFTIVSNNNTVSILNSKENDKIEVYSIGGTKITSVIALGNKTDISLKNKGIYLVKVGAFASKIVL
jgi:hypothetical protein